MENDQVCVYENVWAQTVSTGLILGCAGTVDEYNKPLRYRRKVVEASSIDLSKYRKLSDQEIIREGDKFADSSKVLCTCVATVGQVVRDANFASPIIGVYRASERPNVPTPSVYAPVLPDAIFSTPVKFDRYVMHRRHLDILGVERQSAALAVSTSPIVVGPDNYGEDFEMWSPPWRKAK